MAIGDGPRSMDRKTPEERVLLEHIDEVASELINFQSLLRSGLPVSSLKPNYDVALLRISFSGMAASFEALLVEYEKYAEKRKGEKPK